MSDFDKKKSSVNNNENYNKYSTPEEIKEYYKNGGRGVIFDFAA